MGTPAVIFDIDGTLADVAHRRHHVAGGKRDWDAFFAAMHLDPPVDPIARLNNIVSDADVHVILCSGRPEKYRAVTEEWLRQHELDWHRLHMRPDNDVRPDHVVKGQMLDAILADGYEPFLVIDDRPSVVRMWRERGLTCLQCNDRWDEVATDSIGALSIMVGPSGAGKSTWLASSAAIHFGIFSHHVISSDAVRADLCGDFRDQSRNDDVFPIVHTLAKARITAGLPAVIDATNLRRRDRLACASLSPGGLVRYYVIDRPMEEKRRDAGWRAELPIDLLAKHDQTFRSQLKDILAGDGLPNVTVIDLRVSDVRG